MDEKNFYAENLIPRALNFLLKSQSKTGDFPTQSSTKIHDFSHAKSIRANYVSANILHILGLLPTKYKAKPNITKARRYLLGELSSRWQTMNYWPRDSKEFNAYAVPDDFDDTAVAHASLTETGKTKSTKVFFPLMQREAEIGGPYYTWWTDGKGETWNDIDLGVNANILWFMGLNEVSLKNTVKFIHRETEKRNFKTRYFPDYMTLYFISRAFRDGNMQEDKKLWSEIAGYCLSYIKKSFPLAKNYPSIVIATTTTCLINFSFMDYKITQEFIQMLIDSQNPDGSWDAGGTTIGHTQVTSGEKCYDGSKAMTTALAIEAILKFTRTDNLIVKREKETAQKITFDEIYKNVRRKADKIIRDKLITKSQRSFYKKVLSESFTRRAAILPALIQQSLPKDKRQNCTEEFAIDVGANNIIGWTYYKILDNEIDEGIDSKELLKLKIDCKRIFFSFFKNAFKDSAGFSDFLAQSIKTQKAILKWEINQCRFSDKTITSLPSYKKISILADRSLPYTFAVAAIYQKAGFPVNSPEAKSVIDFLESYLIAKQLNDDAHDWENDLKWGHINSVAAMILEKHNQPFRINKANLEQLNRQFWETDFEKVVQEIKKQIRLARNYLAKSGLHKNTKARFILDEIQTSYEKASKERDIMLAIMNEY